MAMSRQDRIDAVDEEMFRTLLPESARADLAAWWSANREQYRDGPGAHSIRYAPARWSSVSPWPVLLADRSRTGDAYVTRAEVVRSVEDALAREAWREALVATFVWGKGKSGSPKGAGPSVLAEEILQSPVLDEALTSAVTELRTSGPVAAYELLDRASVKQLGPAFFTKFLYFVDQAAAETTGVRALILDRNIAGVLRARASAVGRELGLDPDESLAVRAWGDQRSGRWTSHRYGVYLAWMEAANRQLAAAGPGWPAWAGPDLLELALFGKAWQP